MSGPRAEIYKKVTLGGSRDDPGPPEQNTNLDAGHGRGAAVGQPAGRPVPGAPRPDRSVLWYGRGRGRPAGAVRARRPRPGPSGHRPPATGDLPRPALAVQRP